MNSENQGHASRFVKCSTELRDAKRELQRATIKVANIENTITAIHKQLAASVGQNIQQKLFQVEGFSVLVRYIEASGARIYVFDSSGEEVT